MKLFNYKAIEKGELVQFLISLIIGIIMSLLITHYETTFRGTDFNNLMYSFSAGFFATAIIYIGFGLLTLIAAAGNFYGLQYIGYALVFTFSFKKEHFERRRKSYYDFVLEKEEKAAKGKSLIGRFRMLAAGLILLLISIGFTILFYI